MGKALLQERGYEVMSKSRTTERHLGPKPSGPGENNSSKRLSDRGLDTSDISNSTLMGPPVVPAKCANQKLLGRQVGKGVVGRVLDAVVLDKHGGVLGDILSVQVGHQGQGHVDARGDSGGGDDSLAGALVH